MYKGASPTSGLFQSTLPRGERRQSENFFPMPPLFQSTLPRGERQAPDGYQVAFVAFQSTLPRGERLYSMLDDYFDSDISIHAPTRGATRQCRGLCAEFRFQSTLPRGERRIQSIANAASSIFQSTLPRGERRNMIRQFTNNVKISIHAPTRGATPASWDTTF